MKSSLEQKAFEEYVMSPESLIAWRDSLRLSKRAMSMALGCGQTSISLWENGTNAIPKYIALACSALTFKLPPMDSVVIEALIASNAEKIALIQELEGTIEALKNENPVGTKILLERAFKNLVGT